MQICNAGDSGFNMVNVNRLKVVNETAPRIQTIRFIRIPHGATITHKWKQAFSLDELIFFIIILGALVHRDRGPAFKLIHTKKNLLCI